MRAERGELSGVKVDDMIEYNVGGRAASTLSTYAAAFKKVWAYAEEIGVSLFRWGEGEMMGMMIGLEKEGAAENKIKQVSAVVSLVFECMGKESPNKSALVLKVRKTCVKKCNERKAAALVPASAERVGCTLGDMRKMIDGIYVSGASEADLCRKRCLVMQVFFFVGVKGFSDVAKLKVKDVSFLKDGSLEVLVRKSKTDQVGRGAKFYLSGKKVRGVCLPKIVKWYLKGLGLHGEDMMFPRMRSSKGRVVAIKGLPRQGS